MKVCWNDDKPFDMMESSSPMRATIPKVTAALPHMRKRTSAFVGCTLTSTVSGGISMNTCASGLRSRAVAAA